MKQFKLTSVLIVLLSMVGLQVFADWDTSTEIKIDGLYYYLDNDNLQAVVTSAPEEKYSGDITIPTSFNYQAKTYSVTSIEYYAFRDCSGLTSVIIPNSVTSIGSSAFEGCSGLPSVIIPNSVTSIGGSAFKDTQWLNNQPDGLVYAGLNAYQYKGKMPDNTAITIKDGTKSICPSAFDGCTSLTSVIIPNSVTSIGGSAFEGCSNLTSVTIPNSVTSIGGSAFEGCSNLTSVTIPNSVTSIEYDAFRDCSGLTSVIIPNSVTSIGSSAFRDCSGLTSVIIPNSVTSIGSSAFKGCSGLTSITIPNSVTSIWPSAFNECSSLKKVIVSDIAAWCEIDFGGYLANPLSYAHHLYSDENTEITSLIIPDGVTNIGRYAFYGCSDLTSVTIPESVTSIGNNAFRGCSGLTSITIPNSVTSIGNNVFKDCANISDLKLDCTNIGNWFADIKLQIKTLTIGNNVQTIDNYAFEGCSGLTSVTIPNSVTSIGDNAFISCTNISDLKLDCTNIRNWFADSKSQIKTLTIGNNVQTIGNNAFSGCSGLTSVTIPNSVKSIEYYAFKNCSGLTSVTIPNSVTSIGGAAFEGCSCLTSVTLNSNAIASYRYTSISMKNIFGEQVTEYIIGEDVTSIGCYAFKGCSGLTSVTIPNSVTSIGDYAFANCSALKKVIASDIAAWCGISFDGFDANPLYYAHHLYSDENTEITNLVIPEDVTSIGSYAFKGCSGLISVTIPNSVTSIGDDAFSGCYALEKVIIEDITAWCGIKFSSSEANPLYYAHHFYSDENTEITSLVIPDGVKNISDYAFYGFSGLVSVIIPNSVTSIGVEAFFCSAITSITIPESVTSIGSGAFAFCSALTSVTIPNSLTSIGDNVFAFCSALTSVTISKSVTSIGDYAFQGCSALTSVTLNSNAIVSKTYTESNNMKNIFGEQVTEYIIGEDVTNIGKYAFYGCFALTSVTLNSNAIVSKTYTSSNNLKSIFGNQVTEYIIGNDVTSIGSYAFKGCSGLTSITIPESVTNIDSSAFSGCSGLTSITIPNSVTSIGVSAFKDTQWLYNQPDGLVYAGLNAYKYKGTMPDNTTITIKDGTKSICPSAFNGCTSLTSVTIPNSVTSIGGSAFYGCSALEKVIIEDIAAWCGISFGDNPLYYAHHLYCDENTEITSLVIPDGVTSISSSAFQSCSSLLSVKLPNSVTSIGDDVFTDCSSLQHLYSLAKSVPEAANAFRKGIAFNLATLHVPAESMYKYNAADGWNKFVNIVALADEEIADLNVYKLIYMVDGEVYKTLDVEFGSTITPETEPTKEGYTFSGWSEIPETMPAHDVIVTGTFECSFDVGNLTKVIDFIMNSTASTEDIGLYDLNNNKKLDIGDVILIVKFILNNNNNAPSFVRRRSSEVTDLTHYTAAQFEVRTVGNVNVGNIRLVKSMEQTHQLMYQRMDANTYAVVVYSMSNQLMQPENGKFIEIGNNSDILSIENAIVATPTGETAYYNTISTTTVIEQTERENGTAVIYDLKGHRLKDGKALEKGIYIVNGKKTVVR